ncbi:MAG: alpha/beta hydrolase, partial [Proteobacteria bacterium]|nr:alpha/beta hydrolase [Pseudomonadota bacterium]
MSKAPAVRRGFVERPDARLYYEVCGSGPALIFAHGLGGNHLSWWQQVPAFAGRFTCVVFAHRGFAPSSCTSNPPDPADYPGDLAALLDHLAIERAHLVGQSMGGWTVIGFALAHPARVLSLTL